MDLENTVKHTIFKKHLIKRGDYLLLMVSGGSDSVALAYVMNSLYPGKFSIMHLNHNLRAEAKFDEEFVQGLAKHLHVKCYTYSKSVGGIAAKNKENIEACGRNIRYECAQATIDEISKTHKIPKDKIKIVTAHNADERIENFYMRSIVGTGPGGLASMNYSTKNVIRPLLDLPKSALVEYIQMQKTPYVDECGLMWHEDKTNRDTDHFRAYVRHNIIPLAKKQNPKIIKNLCNSMNLIADENDYMEKQVKKVSDEYIDFNDDSFLIKPGFNEQDLVLKRRAIYNALLKIFKSGTRIDTKTITSILASCEKSNYTDNIQENYSVHSNKKGSLIQPMQKYRESRNRL